MNLELAKRFPKGTKVVMTAAALEHYARTRFKNGEGNHHPRITSGEVCRTPTRHQCWGGELSVRLTGKKSEQRFKAAFWEPIPGETKP